MGTDRKVRLVATESQFYGTRQLRPGDEFEAGKDDAEDILALGIGRVSEKPLSVKQATKRPAKPVKPKRKYIKSGLYKRRDMRAED
jgi:hypothetical protein